MSGAPKNGRIIFRTTAGKGIGFGHLRRCLTLAAALRDAGGADLEIGFWIHGSADAATFCGPYGFEGVPVEGEEPSATTALLENRRADILVVDAYDITAGSLSTWRLYAGRVVVIDDLADRFLDAHAVLNGSPNAASLSYQVSPGCEMWLGPRYALLRPAYRDRPPREVRGAVARLLITLGGADPDGLTAAAIRAARRALPDAHLDVLVGPLFGAMPELDAMARADERVSLHRAVEEPAPLMAMADMAVSAGGQTVYELAATGLPAVAICLAANQEGNLDALAAVPTLAALPRPQSGNAADWVAVEEAIQSLANDNRRRRQMSEAGRKLIDGWGAARVAEKMLALMP